MAAIQLNFTLRTSANCKTVHLIGSWDRYAGQLPLSKDTSKAGGWKGAFRFQGQTLKQGQRYWYYYIIDGYHVSHDPAREYVTEPTTNRKLNVLDIPYAKAAAAPATKSRQSRKPNSLSVSIPKGRPLERSEIVSPRPYKPHETKKVRHEQFHYQTLEELRASLAASELDDSTSEDSESEYYAGSHVPPSTPSSLSLGGSSHNGNRSGSSNSSRRSTPSSVSSTSSCCSCELYGVTRAGARVKLDCGGSHCGGSDLSECYSEADEGYYKKYTTRRGIAVRR